LTRNGIRDGGEGRCDRIGNRRGAFQVDGGRQFRVEGRFDLGPGGAGARTEFGGGRSVQSVLQHAGLRSGTLDDGRDAVQFESALFLVGSGEAKVLPGVAKGSNAQQEMAPFCIMADDLGVVYLTLGTDLAAISVGGRVGVEVGIRDDDRVRCVSDVQAGGGLGIELDDHKFLVGVWLDHLGRANRRRWWFWFVGSCLEGKRSQDGDGGSEFHVDKQFNR